MSLRSSFVFASALLAAACGGSTPSQPAAPANPPDLVIVNGKVHVAMPHRQIVIESLFSPLINAVCPVMPIANFWILKSQSRI